MQAYDGQLEQKGIEDASDRRASQALNNESSELIGNRSSLGGVDRIPAKTSIQDGFDLVQNSRVDDSTKTERPDSLNKSLKSSGPDKDVKIERAEKAEGPGVKAFAKPYRPGVLSDLGTNWKDDGSGNFVTMGRFGRLLTRDHRGRLVDYEQHVDATRSAERSQMAFASVFFCSPLMLLGLGASFAVMDQFHNANRQKNIDRLKGDLQGRRVGVDTNANKSYQSDLVKKAVLMTYQGRGTSSVPDANGIVKLPGSDSGKKKEKKDAERRDGSFSAYGQSGSPFRAPPVGSVPTDGKNLNRAKLVKEKRKLEEMIEKTRGRISYQESSMLHARLEVLDKALTRLSGLGM